MKSYISFFMFCFIAICSSQSMAQNVFPPAGSAYIETHSDPVLTFNKIGSSWQYLEFKNNNIRQTWMGLNDANNFYLTKESQGNIVLYPANGHILLAPDGGNVGIGTYTPTGHLSFGRMGNHLTIGNAGFASQVILATGWNTTNGDYTELRVPGAAGNNGLLRMQGNGNVGIGTDNPGSFKLAVEGSIAARGVKVTLQNPFPDYVFESNYELRPLANLESYINQNKHLPGIPSAAEVKKDGGIELGDMNVKLLEKIEELTLYVIDLKKENEQMKKEIMEIRKKK